MNQRREWCIECGGSFGIRARCELAPNTCTDCAQTLRPSIFGECEYCQRMLQRGEKIHLGMVKLCRKCAEKYNWQNSCNLRCETVSQ